MKHRIIAMAAIMATLTFASAGVALADPKDKVTICHATDSDTNPYVMKEPAANGDVSGHDGHDGPVWPAKDQSGKWGDIIPPFEYVGGSYPGQNWDEAGQALYESDCQTPGESPDPSTPASEEPSTPASEEPSFEASNEGDTDAPSEPQTDALGANGIASPADGAWLLVVALGVLLASIVVLTPARAKSQR